MVKLIASLSPVAISMIRLPGFPSNALDKSSAYPGPPGDFPGIYFLYSQGDTGGRVKKILTPADRGRRQFGSYLARNLTPEMEKKGKKEDERYRRI
ncbi:hypothetical protein TNCV_1298901 [Trichonephila clavipes]|nr:hypothetical protein TNCV_1298901 [Trichonephila clavipes]